MRGAALDVLELIGAFLVVAGLALVAVPAALVVAGVFLIAAANSVAPLRRNEARR